MKHKNIDEELQDLSRKYLNVMSLHKNNEHARHELSVHQIKKVLKAAFLMGERLGYGYGIIDGKYRFFGKSLKMK